MVFERPSNRKIGDGFRGSVRVLSPVLVPLDDEHRAAAIRCLAELLIAGMAAEARRAEVSPSLGTLGRKDAQEKESA